MNLFFDMDGTIADLYGVNNWLSMLRAYDATPYIAAKPLFNMSLFARLLNKLQAKGHQICIISWLSKEPNDEYDEAVTRAKQQWLRKHLPSVKWDEIYIVAYGTPKQNFKLTENDMLFDDEEKNRASWGDFAREPSAILNTLLSLAH